MISFSVNRSLTDQHLDFYKKFTGHIGSEAGLFYLENKDSYYKYDASFDLGVISNEIKTDNKKQVYIGTVDDCTDNNTLVSENVLKADDVILEFVDGYDISVDLIKLFMFRDHLLSISGVDIIGVLRRYYKLIAHNLCTTGDTITLITESDVANRFETPILKKETLTRMEYFRKSKPHKILTSLLETYDKTGYIESIINNKYLIRLITTKKIENLYYQFLENESLSYKMKNLQEDIYKSIAI